MSFARCPCCGEVSHPFGSGGGQALAEELGVPLLAEIPLDEPLRVSADGGTPLVVSAPDADSAQAVAALAEGLPGALRPGRGRSASPGASECSPSSLAEPCGVRRAAVVAGEGVPRPGAVVLQIRGQVAVDEVVRHDV